MLNRKKVWSLDIVDRPARGIDSRASLERTSPACSLRNSNLLTSRNDNTFAPPRAGKRSGLYANSEQFRYTESLFTWLESGKVASKLCIRLVIRSRRGFSDKPGTVSATLGRRAGMNETVTMGSQTKLSWKRWNNDASSNDLFFKQVENHSGWNVIG